MERIRLRLLFDDRHLLSKTQKSEGLKRSWLLLKPELETVDDLSSYLIHTFDLEDACPNGLLLSMDGFVLPLFESTRILKDKDIIRVKRKGGTLIDVIRVGDDANSIEDSEIIEKRPVLTGVKLLAIEEFEKETGGYQSDPEEDEHGGPESPLSFENTLSEKTISKKRKSSKKLHSSKRKKARVTSPEQHSLVPEGIENDGYPEQNESCYNSKVCSHKNHHKKVKSSKVNGKSSIAHTSEVDEKANNIADSTPTEERCGQAQENGTASVDLSHVAAGTRKFPSRSARRKKAKRQWLRELARSQKKEEQSATGQIIQSHTPEEDIHEKFLEHQQPDQNTDKEDEIVPIVVRPGHIRFEPLGEDLVIRQNPDQVETFWWNGTTSKKKGQKWGKEKTSLCGRNDNKDFNQDLIEKLIVEEREVVHDPIDFDNLIPLSSSPKEGDIVAYRLVELSSSWCPELSSFRVGKVSWCDSGSNRVRLVPLPEYPIVSDEKIDEDASAMQPETTLYNEDGSLEIDFASLVDVRIVYHGNSNRAAVVSGESVEVPVNNHDAVSGVDCNSNIEDIRAPITGKGEQVNLWEEISQTLSEKKTQLLQKDGWTKNESSGRNAWSYKALRSSALGPTMALLRAQSER